MFSLNSPYHVTADRVSFAIDKAICLDTRNDKPIIPATSLKGIMRYNIENIINYNNKKKCSAPVPNNMCGKCDLCRIFGSPENKALLIFEDAIIEEPELSSRMSAAIERRRKTAKEDHLFSYEIGFGKTFSTNIKGLLSNRDDAMAACSFIYIGARSCFAFGGGKSRGLGWIEMKDFRASIDGKEVSIEEINKKMAEMLQ